MGTARQIITDALKLLRVWQKGKNIDADQAADGLRSLNLMLDSWSNDRLSVYYNRELTHSLTSGTAQYTIGHGGDVLEASGTAQAGAASTITLASTESAVDDKWRSFQIVTTGGTGSGQRKEIDSYAGSTKIATVDSDWSTNPDSTTTYEVEAKRPLEIHKAWIRDSNNLDWPIEPITNDQWSRISLKAPGNTYPEYLYYRPDFPLGQINLYSPPGSGLTLYLQVWDLLTQFTTLDEATSFPPGYERAIIYNLAIEISPMYRGNVSQSVAAIANDSLEKIQSTNEEPIFMQNDLPCLGTGYNRRRGFFNNA